MPRTVEVAGYDTRAVAARRNATWSTIYTALVIYFAESICKVYFPPVRIELFGVTCCYLCTEEN